jgi:MFS superfamily sulfate permease-like transporter
MFQRHSGPRLPLEAALKAYWPWLLPLVLCSAVIFFVPNAAVHFWLVSGLFLVSAVSAAWPWLRRDAPYSFWIVAAALWFCSGLVCPIIAAVVSAIVARSK